jgi:hypothetical protein
MRDARMKAEVTSDARRWSEFSRLLQPNRRLPMSFRLFEIKNNFLRFP